MAILAMVRVPAPGLERDSVRGPLVVFTTWLPKFRLMTEGSATATARPVKFTVCVLPATPLLLSVMVRVPVIVPAVAVSAGEKVTLMVQEPPIATLPPRRYSSH